MALRSLTGLGYQQKLGVGFFGEVFRGHDAGDAVRIVHVDPELARLPGLPELLEEAVESLTLLEDPRVVIARRVGLDDDGNLVIVTDHVKGPLSLEDLMRHSVLPTDIAVAITFGVVQAIAYAHSLNRVHGGVHPRSVLLDFDGSVRLADFALASALAHARGAGGKPSADGVGYVAPEVRAGADPSVASDIYAVGAVMVELLTGRLPGATPRGSAALIEVMSKATAADPEKRFLNGTELEEALEDAALRDGQRVALDRDIASYVTELLSTAEEELDAETEDVLAQLGLSVEEPIKRTQRVAVVPPARNRAMSDILGALEEELEPHGVPDGSDPALIAGDIVSAGTESGKLPPLPKPKTRPGFEYRSKSDVATQSDTPSGKAKAASNPDATMPGVGTLSPARPNGSSRKPPGKEDDDEVGFEDPSATGELTAVEDPDQIRGRVEEPDLISQIVEADPVREDLVTGADEDTPLPAPAAHHDQEGSVTKHLAALKAEGHDSERSNLEAAQAMDAVFSLDDTDSIAALAVAPTEVMRPFTDIEPDREPIDVDDDPLAGFAAAPGGLGVSPPNDGVARDLSGAAPGGVPFPPPPLHKNHNLMWAALTVFVLASLFGILYTRTDIFTPEREQAAQDIRRMEEERQIRAFEGGQPKTGTIVIDSTPGEAAVWMLIGRTPVDSFLLPAGRVHELRLEHEGYLLLDLPVTAVHWTVKDGQLRAEVRGKLSPGEPRGPIPAFPPEPEVPRAAGVDGNGINHVESTPPGAQVWMLIGFTPEARLSQAPAGQDYEFKLLKNGFRPGFAVVKADQWYLAGPDSPVRPGLSRSVELAPIATDSKKPKKRR